MPAREPFDPVLQVVAEDCHDTGCVGVGEIRCGSAGIGEETVPLGNRAPPFPTHRSVLAPATPPGSEDLERGAGLLGEDGVSCPPRFRVTTVEEYSMGAESGQAQRCGRVRRTGDFLRRHGFLAFESKNRFYRSRGPFATAVRRLWMG